jgi:hypothetical protein
MVLEDAVKAVEAAQGSVSGKKALESAFSERFQRPLGYVAHQRRSLQKLALMVRTIRGQHSRPETALGLGAFCVEVVNDAPISEGGRLTQEVLSAPLSSHLFQSQLGGWAGERDAMERANAQAAELPFSAAFAEMLGLNEERSISNLGDMFSAAIEVAAKENLAASVIQFDLNLVWRRPAAVLTIKRRARPGVMELLATFGDTSHRPGQGIVQIKIEDIQFLGDLLAKGA